MTDKMAFQPCSLRSIPPLAAQVDLWLVDLDRSDELDDTAGKVLSPVELERATRYRFDRDRKRFLRRRFFLRSLLGVYSGISANDLVFAHSPYGKPFLAGQPVSFNISDSGGWSLMAFARTLPLGVDIEQARPLSDLALIASRYFSPLEQAGLLALPASLQIDSFYHIWTQKEAFIKAIGMGLSFPLDAFDVLVHPLQAGGVQAVRTTADVPIDWQMHTFIPVEGFHAAVCYPAPKREIRSFVYARS